MITLYGIPNCDTVKKARTWLTAHGVEHVFHDFKKQGVPEAALDHWLASAGWERVLNRKGTTWRKLSDEQKAAITDAATATELMLASPSVIKRPVLFNNKKSTVGFSADLYQHIFQD